MISDFYLDANKNKLHKNAHVKHIQKNIEHLYLIDTNNKTPHIEKPHVMGKSIDVTKICEYISTWWPPLSEEVQG